MSVARTRRKRVATSVRPPRSTRKPQRRRFLRRPIWLVLLAAIALLILIVSPIGSIFSGGGKSPAVGGLHIQYSVVSGDTPSIVASAFGVDERELMQQSGVASTDAPLTPGSLLLIDASRLWKRMREAPNARNEALVEATARRLGVEPALALAVAWQESRLQESARSSTGAVGIMQVEPDTSRLASVDLGVPIDATNASDNVLAGVFWLHSLLGSYSGDQSAALAAYYEGPGNLARRGYLRGTAEYVAHARQLRHALLVAEPSLGP